MTGKASRRHKEADPKQPFLEGFSPAPENPLRKLIDYETTKTKRPRRKTTARVLKSDFLKWESPWQILAKLRGIDPTSKRRTPEAIRLDEKLRERRAARNRVTAWRAYMDQAHAEHRHDVLADRMPPSELDKDGIRRMVRIVREILEKKK